uniref:Uncharacterized protein n=1 Tax=Panagrolaimus sp. ES5 TaxID=591445 RepID=A0AC34GBQ7_9BILA
MTPSRIAQYQHSFLNKILSTRAYVRKIFKSLNIQDYNFNVGDIAFMNAVTYCGCEIDNLKRASRAITFDIVFSGETVRKRHCSLSLDDAYDLSDPYCML